MKKKVLSVFLSLCMTVTCMAGISVATAATCRAAGGGAKNIAIHTGSIENQTGNYTGSINTGDTIWVYSDSENTNSVVDFTVIIDNEEQNWDEQKPKFRVGSTQFYRFNYTSQKDSDVYTIKLTHVNSCFVHYNYNFGVVPTVVNETYAEPPSALHKPSSAPKEGVNVNDWFVGWFTAPTGGNQIKWISPSDISSNSETTLYAHWNIPDNTELTVSFSVGGTGRSAAVLKTQSVTVGGFASAPTDLKYTPDTTGFADVTITKWFSDPDCGNPFDLASTPINGDTTLYGWVNKVEFWTDQSNMFKTEYHQAGDKLTEPALQGVTPPDGKVLNGWKTGSWDSDMLWDFDVAVVGRNVISLYANWTDPVAPPKPDNPDPVNPVKPDNPDPVDPAIPVTPDPAGKDNTDPVTSAEDAQTKEPQKTTVTTDKIVDPTTHNETVSEKTVTKTETGTVETQTKTVKDPDGNTLSTSKSRTVTDDKAGTKTETSVTTDFQNGTVTKEKSVSNIKTKAVEETRVISTIDGRVKNIVTATTDTAGVVTETTYVPVNPGADQIKVTGIMSTGQDQGVLTIPAEVDAADGGTYTVTEISERAFKNNTDITDVVIPTTVTHIGRGAFNGASNIQTITISVAKAKDFEIDRKALKGLEGTVVTIIAKNKKQFNRIVAKMKAAGGTDLIYVFEKAK